MYLSLKDQNKLANTVFTPLQKLPYRFSSTERVWPAIESLDHLQDRVVFISTMSMIKIDLARERLARRVWQELSEMTHAFQENEGRVNEASVLIAHLQNVRSLMQKASELNHSLDLHFRTMRKYALLRYFSPGSLEKAFKSVEKECEKISKGLVNSRLMIEHARESKEEYSSSKDQDSLTTGSGSASTSHSSLPVSPVAVSPNNSVSEHLPLPQSNGALNPARSLSQSSSKSSSVVIMHRTATVAFTDKRPSTSQASSIDSVEIEKALCLEGFAEVEMGHDAGGYAASVDLAILGSEPSGARDIFNKYIEDENVRFLSNKTSSKKDGNDVKSVDFCIDPGENSGQINKKNVFRS